MNALFARSGFLLLYGSIFVLFSLFFNVSYPGCLRSERKAALKMAYRHIHGFGICGFRCLWFYGYRGCL